MHPEIVHIHLRERVRLDVWLTRRLAGVSRNRVQRHIARGDVLVDGRRVRSSHVLVGGETLTLVPMAVRRATAPVPVALRCVYEDADLVVIDKPPGLVVHPVGSEFRRTLLGALQVQLESRGEDASALGIVHRLDKLTSGLIVVAKRLAARRALARAVESRAMRRSYLALCAGAPPADAGTINLWIRRDPARPTRMQALDAAGVAAAERAGRRPPVSASGYSDPRLDLRPRPAVTRYRVLRRLRGATLLRCDLETGRTHQIRVHLQGVGAPLLGDPLYGTAPGLRLDDRLAAAGRVLARPALHAAALCFAHPATGAPLRFRAPLPPDLRAAIAAL